MKWNINIVYKIAIMALIGTASSILSSSILFSNYVSAYSASITTSNSISLDVSPAGDGTAIQSESINVVSDCRNGYNLSISTPNGSDLYKYTNGVADSTASFTAVDGTSALSSSNNTNKWGFVLSSNPTSSTVFSPLSTTPSVLKTSTETASSGSDINDIFSIHYGIKVDGTIEPGTYQMADDGSNTPGSIVYYLTMDATCTQYTVEFNPNGGTVTSGGNNPTENIQEGVPTKLTSKDIFTAPVGATYTDADNNTITGDPDKLWTFWGWNTEVDGTGDWYKDREEVEDLVSAGSTITLYAQWKQATLADMTTGTPAGTEKVIDHNEMQDMSPAACYNSPITTAANAPAATLKDYRGKVTTGDNPESPEEYTVSKLADGLCWMTTNLNLGRSGTDGPNGDGTVTLTSDDTDLADNTTFTLPAGDTESYTATGNLAKVRLTNTSSATTNGAYYTWAAAVANTESTNTSPTTSICPKNWDLPTNVNYTNLNSKSSYSSSNRTTAQPSNFLINGGFTDGLSFNQTSYSYFWTNTSSSTTAAYGARVASASISTSSSTSTTYGGNKYYRKNIRCITSLGEVTINYDGNGTTEYPVTGSVASQEKVEIVSARTQSGAGFTRTNWVFKNWNTAPDGSGTTISTNALISILDPKPGEIITLYAQWLPQYTITYVNNCMTYASTNSACTNAVSNTTDAAQKIDLTNNPSTGTETGTLAAYNKWALTGWKIKGWSTVANNSDNSNTEYGVGKTYAVPSGSGAGSGITLYAHWVPVYSIQYDGNNADNPNGMGTTNETTGVKSVTQTNVGEGDPIILLASNFKKAGNGFAGWSTDPDAWSHFTDNDSTNDPIIYGPMETISAPAYPTNGTNIITMYAVWVPAEKDGSNNPIYLQEWDDLTDATDGCAALTSTTLNSTTGEITASKNGIIALTDKRDDEVYTIAKLADDNCWMIENLRLEHAGTVGNNKNDGSFTNQSLAQGYGGTPGTYGSFVGLAASESANFSNTKTSLSFADGGIYKSSASSPTDTYNPATSTLEDIGSNDSPGYRFPRYNNSNNASALSSPTFTENYDNASSPSTIGTYKTSTVSSYGNYYTWAAAMANTNYYTSSSTSEAADTSICPSGWHLPSSNGIAKENGTLSQRYGGTGNNQADAESGGDIMSNRFRSFPNNFLYSGNFNGSSARNRGASGNYWSRSANSNSNSYSLDLSSTNLSLSSSNNKNNGFSVRCLVDYTYTIQYDGNGAYNPNGMGTTDARGRKSVKQIEITEGISVTLLPSNFKRAGYGFAGWSTDPDAWSHFTDNDSTNDPIIYGPMETISAPAYPTNGTNIITMYAVWVPAEISGGNPVYLQDWNSCSTLTSAAFNSTTGAITASKNGIIALTDKRDDEVYTIAKLADDNCWMVENLRLEHEGTVGNNKNDSSVTNESLAQGYGGTTGTYGNFVGLAASESANFRDITTYLSFADGGIYKSSASSPTDTYNPATSTLEDIGSTNHPGYRFPRYNNSNNASALSSPTFTENYDNASSPSTIGTYKTSTVSSYGNYYTWAAAMANTNYYTSSSTSEAADTSICPSGWHLPSSNGIAKENGTLSQRYGGTGNNQADAESGGDIMSNRFRSFPNNFLYSGYFSVSSVDLRGSNGHYWSRSAYSNDASHFLFLRSTLLNPSGAGIKDNGFSVRCLIES